ncbi:MAG: cystathionine gamma-synthase [Bacteroidetes bacterium GWA2_30_7]|nr:MAG: cystathionine gamma-synthase [Bacteroidetes bacterium GWA2_30_7]
MKNDKYKGFATKAIHSGEEPNLKDGGTGDVVVPIHISSTFARKEIEVPTAGYEYSRSLNPTRKALEEKLAVLENAKYGLAFASGLAAESIIILSLLKSGDHLIAFDDLYGGTKRLFNKVFSDFGITVTYVNATNPNNIITAIKKETKLIWLETPTNPLLKICDIKAISEIAKKNELYLVVDNTFLSPYFQNPLDLGADLVVHSSTKYIGGHSDVIGGSIMLSDSTIYEKLQFNQNAIGAIPSPFDCFLTMRGIKTLEIRMKKHAENAIVLARALEKHPKIKKVIYPGLESHPQFVLSKKQCRGFGGIITFLIDGDINNVKKFMAKLKVFALAESLGGVESLIEHPALMTHASLVQTEREKLGITDNLIRVSVGIEDVSDLWNDLQQALD